MNTKNIQNKINDKYRDHLNNFLSQYNYDWFVTLSLPNYNVEDSEKYLKIWKINLQKKYNIQISYVGVIVLSKHTGSHFHLLMYGKNEEGETLLDRDKRIWEKEWSCVTKGCDCVIERVNDNGVVDYITYMNTPEDYFELVNPYNKKLLNKFKTIH